MQEMNDIVLTMPDYHRILVEELAAGGNRQAMLRAAGHWTRWGHDGGNVPACGMELTVKYLSQLAEEGDAEAMLLLGTLYYVGLGVGHDYRQAMEWYAKAAAKGNLDGMNNLGYCHYYGRDTDVDYAKAYECFACAAIDGHYNAMYKLGDMYLHGYHVAKDEWAAFYWFNRADDHCRCPIGQASVDYRLGHCHLHGYGTAVDLKEALRHLYGAEFAFIRQIEDEIAFAALTLPKVRKDIEMARELLYRGVEGSSP